MRVARRSAIAAFYRRDGALVVFNGVPERSTREELRRPYEGAWSPPAYFAWENLTYDPVSPTHVLVNGGFRWRAVSERDTVRYVHAAMLATADSGMGIIFEHETLRPKP